ncbi:gliding motility-associated ABC transporter ATP-binding subunit GldA [Thermaurantimonas aggregans]|uniref:Gliding motility-associated ABC transporter ATP-binding subunit GldA n=1 Tax=Thermaurantimonas aggregans TaxID=2173829 RepID=A0A401XL61_9FLAO|nr:gliding motility-associated ABC transporter ATP-binding subunit GldA [Thermaurantimonas aggregans]MCX8148173.1 gliding motility-associated ABC transporter ATP-binding subunit GldA [Thermaurantimonas aggregans]GCD77759.1 gliding motility-associated ABC transporter ATP-binding subunit GldA [Thermaurantimonas aggregans]
MSLEVQKVTKIYGTQRALDKVSFKVKKGEIVGFLGPNGAGKSTMMKILTGFIPATEGYAAVDGLDVNQHSIEVRKKIGYLPEHNPLYLDMYVREFLRFMAGLQKVPKSRVEEMIEKTGLTPEAHKRIGQLSKGYRQRVGLAHALIHDPEVLILDEPTTGLDPNQIVEIRQLIKELGRSKTVMLSTHIMQEVEILCDRVIIINKGKIVADTTTEALKQASGRQTLVVQLEKEVSAAWFKSIDGVLKVKREASHWLIDTDAQKDLRKAIFEKAVATGNAILSIQLKDVKLEDVFRLLTQSEKQPQA